MLVNYRGIRIHIAGYIESVIAISSRIYQITNCSSGGHSSRICKFAIIYAAATIDIYVTITCCISSQVVTKSTQGKSSLEHLYSVTLSTKANKHTLVKCSIFSGRT